MNKAEAFFYENAGYSYDPKIETKAQGRKRCAKFYAKAEADAREAGVSFVWDIDPHCTSRDFSDARPIWALWECRALDAKGRVAASLGGVDFGRNGDPWSGSYRRVVEAELAGEVLARSEPC
jgi:hypothetical protein